jgi:hypothetical protein
MLKIVLNTELKSTEITGGHWNDKKAETGPFKFPEEKFDAKHVSTNQDLLQGGKTENNLINAILTAYNHHRGLVLRPEDILMTLGMAVSNCVNDHAEEMRGIFVDHEGKENLVVTLASPPGHWDWDLIMELINQMLEKKIKQGFPLKPEFSTTTVQDITAFNLVNMSTFKEFFGYGFMMCCGIPYVRMMGTQEDWGKLSGQYLKLKAVFQKHHVQYLDYWFDAMDVVMGNIIGTRMLSEDGETVAPKFYEDFWSRIVTYVPYGSGGQKYLSGWSQILFPGSRFLYKDMNLLKPRSLPPVCGGNRSIAIGNSDRPRTPEPEYPPGTTVVNGYYAWQDAMSDWAQITRTNDTVPKGVCTCPFELNDHGDVFDMNFSSGFIGVKEEDGEIAAVVGFYATGNRKDKADITAEAEKHYKDGTWTVPDMTEANERLGRK